VLYLCGSVLASVAVVLPLLGPVSSVELHGFAGHTCTSSLPPWRVSLSWFIVRETVGLPGADQGSRPIQQSRMSGAWASSGLIKAKT
jgi:hypothetical protein